MRSQAGPREGAPAGPPRRHSMTVAASSMRFCGISAPCRFAASGLTTSSSVSLVSTGRSAGFAPSEDLQRHRTRLLTELRVVDAAGDRRTLLDLSGLGADERALFFSAAWTIVVTAETTLLSVGT